MEKNFVKVTVYDQEELIDTFDFELHTPCFITFPDKPPYNGLSHYVTGSKAIDYSFSPDGEWMFIKFNDDKAGKCITYLVDRSYTFYFQSYTKIED